jgi:hypothetical protein
MGDALLSAVIEEIDRLNTAASANRTWTVSEYIVQAVVERLSKTARSAGRPGKVTAEKYDDYRPRRVQDSRS